jgi:tetratricopeptide (TPR) repeat protein
MRSSIRTSSAVIGLVAWITWSSFAWSAPAATQSEARERARRAFTEGQALYDTGHYDAAIEKFREADRLSPSPALLFDVAQAYRQKGACEDALATYRAFLRDAGDARVDLREVAEEHVRELEGLCGGGSAAEDDPATVEPVRATVDESPAAGTTPAQATSVKNRAAIGTAAPPAPEPQPMPEPGAMTARRVSTDDETRVGRRGHRGPAWLVPSFVLSGATVLLVAGGTWIWSEREHARWSAEDLKLQMIRDTPDVFDETSKWVKRQNQNDARLRRIERIDGIALATTIVGGSALLAAGGVAAYRWLFARPTINGGLEISLSLRF